jgi:RNA-directed DNA polymerase
MPNAFQHQLLFGALVAAWLSEGEWSAAALLARGHVVVGQHQLWLAPLVANVVKRLPARQLVERSALMAFLDADSELRAALYAVPVVIRSLALGPASLPVFANDALPQLHNVGDIARWLALSHHEFDWFRGMFRLDAHLPNTLSHYRAQWIAKSRGGARLVEAPKPRLMALQRRVLREILDHVPLHPAVHGFRRGFDAYSHAQVHSGQPLVVRFDLRDFFLSIAYSQIVRAFVRVGYGLGAARALGQLCTHRSIVPYPLALLGASPSREALRGARYAEMLARGRHLPQGAPTSPALANLIASGLDIRLSALATCCGANYSRYADDLVFSGAQHFYGNFAQFVQLVGVIVAEEGFALNPHKTFARSASAQQLVGGLVVNRLPRPARANYEVLKAILHKCILHGPESQNREALPDYRAHLTGLVAWHSRAGGARAGKLAALLRAIDW